MALSNFHLCTHKLNKDRGSKSDEYFGGSRHGREPFFKLPRPPNVGWQVYRKGPFWLRLHDNILLQTIDNYFATDNRYAGSH